MKKKTKKRMLTGLLCIILLLTAVSGCKSGSSAESGGSTDEEASLSTDTNKETLQPSDEVTAMGRYVENITDLSDRTNGWDGGGIYLLSDGRLVITDAYNPFIASEDNGVTWKDDSRPWHSKMLKEDSYIMDIAVGPDNTVAAVYCDNEEDDTAEEDDITLNTKVLIVSPEGEERIADPEIMEEELFINQVYVSDTGRIFATPVGSDNIYEIKEDGSSEVFLTPEEGSPDLIQMQRNLMVIDGYGYDAPLIYDMEKREYLTDEVLEEFVNANYKNRDNMGGIYYDMYFFFGEENILYFAGAKGLYRHVIGGSAMEQVIDGSLCILNNPAYQIIGMTALGNNEFVTLLSGGSVVRFTYDPDIPTVPNERLKVYSLKENDTVRQAITWYQTANPAVFVEYEVGMTEGSVTREDALKTLNTKIMAGDGPDVLVLDNMPLDSYINKGVLMDLSGVLQGQDLFTNITEAFKEEDKIYTVPCEVQIPVILTGEKYAAKATDLKGIADMMEELRKDYTNQDLMRVSTEKGIMRLFAMTCVPAWISEEGDMDKEAIEEFLVQTKRIYDAQMNGTPQERIEEYHRLNQTFVEERGVSRDDSQYLRSRIDVMYYVGGYSHMSCGALVDAYDYAHLISVGKTEGFKDSTWVPMKGQSDNVFYAQTLLGINAASKNVPQAEEFIRVCLGEDNQSSLFNGFAVNKTAFDKKFIISDDAIDESGVYVYASSSDANGFHVSMEIYWPDETQIAELRSCMEQADTPYVENDMLEEAVYAEGIAYLQGTQSLEDTLDRIEQKISIYMAE